MNYGDIIRPGTEIKFKKQYGGINGVVKAVWLSEAGVQYQITYLHNGVVQEPYIPGTMFEVADTDPIPAGFRLPSAPTK